MAKEILLYHEISSYSAEQFISQLDQFLNEDVVVRLNTDGGNPQDGWGMIAKLQERQKKNTLIKVDGKAHSWGAFLLCCVAEVECLDTSTFAFHRAAYGWIEKQPEFKGSPDEILLIEANKKLKKLLAAKIDVIAFEKITGYTIEELFSMDARVDIILNASQAEKIKLVSKIVKITPERRKEISANWEITASQLSGLKMAAKTEPEPPAPSTQTQTPTTMTAKEFKTQFPAVYEEIFNAGVAAEKDRVEAFLVFADVDPEGVKKAIETGGPMTAKQMAEFNRKMIGKDNLQTLKKETEGKVETTEVEKDKEKTEKDKSIEAFDKKVGMSLHKIRPDEKKPEEKK